ncbi:MAG: ribose-phosphate pyrophosphokinase [bacterium]|nr:ribose-phosphate pyrophosphokinase [bacterium]
MIPLVFSLPGLEDFSEKFTQHLGGEAGYLLTHSFPDGETYLRVPSECRNRKVVLLANLSHPNEKILPLLLLGETLRDLGAKEVLLVCPYLPYMRQDKRFQPGEGVTSRYFAKLLSRYFDALWTVNPHLHRFSSLKEIYSVSSQVVDAGPQLGRWIRSSVKKPFLVGPDRESQQWVQSIAESIDVPYRVGEKLRRGDREVSVSLPDLTSLADHTPVLVDDIISTGQTLVRAMEELGKQGLPEPVCVVIHALFAEGAEEALQQAGVQELVTTNTIPHPSNRIDLSEVLAQSVGNHLFK